MQRIALPQTELSVSPLCLGLASLGSKNTEKEAGDLMDCFVDLGGNFLDTARVYSNWIPGERNRSERILGDWLQKTGNRDKLVLATKGGHRNEVDHSLRVTPEEISKDLDGSLKTLRVDHVDLYYLHRDDPSVPVSEIIDYLNQEIGTGRIRYIGCSNWTPERMAEANAYAESNNKQGFVANQPRWSLGSPNMIAPADSTLLKLEPAGYTYHKKHQITLVPYSSQAGGFFSKFSENGNSETWQNSAFNSPENIAIATKLRQLSKDTGINIAHLVLVFLLNRPFPVVPIVGCRIASQMRDSFKCLNVQISGKISHELLELDPWD